MLRVAMGLLVNGAGQVLLGRRAPHKAVLPNRWDAIGGRVELGETDEDALRREVREELGVTPTQLSLLAFGPRRSQGRSLTYWWTLFAVTRWSDGDPINACDEHTAVGWFSPEAMGRLSGLADPNYVRLAQLALRLGTAAPPGGVPRGEKSPTTGWPVS